MCFASRFEKFGLIDLVNCLSYLIKPIKNNTKNIKTFVFDNFAEVPVFVTISEVGFNVGSVAGLLPH